VAFSQNICVHEMNLRMLLQDLGDDSKTPSNTWWQTN